MINNKGYSVPIMRMAGYLAAALLITTPLFMGGVAGCGGGGESSSSATDTTSGGTTAGQASASSLSTVPSVDVSNLDYTTSSSSAAKLEVEPDQAGLVMKSAQGLGNTNAVGNSSRAGCEQNVHKKEILRHSKQATIPFCYARAMEKAKLVVIPSDGTYAYYQVKPPEGSADDFKKSCDKIPPDHKKEIEECKKGAGAEGAQGGMKLRLKKSTSGDTKSLEMDMCEGKDAKSVTEELTYSAKGAIYTATAVRSGSFNGHTDKSAFSATIDLGTTGKVADGIPDLGDGNATATASMDGGFGSGRMTFKATGASKAVTISGLFEGGFKEQRSGSRFESKFTGKTYAESDNSTGCAKFSFAGTMPPMLLKDMIPFNIGEAQLDNFLQNFGLQLGLSITKDNYKTIVLCPNPKFDPQNPDKDKSIKPMVAGGTAGCDTLTHTGVECFSVSNGTKEGQFGKQVTQIFTIIANDKSGFYKSVNAFDLATLDTKKAIEFARKWDCTAETGKSFSDLNFATFTKEQAETAQAAMKDCFKMEEEARGNNGMGGYNCHEKQNQGDMNNFAKNGPPPQGNFGGQCKKTSITCSAGSYTGRDMYFFNTMDKDKGEYCLVSQGSCPKYTATSTTATIPAAGLEDPDGSKVTAITFTQADATKPATAAVITMTVTGPGGTATCTANCTMSQVASFDKPPEFAGPPAGGAPPPGAKPGDAKFVPKSCIDAGFANDGAKCEAHCQETHDCGG